MPFWHLGLVAGQSFLSRHSAQLPVSRQKGVGATQSLSMAHWAHRESWQNGRGAAQSVAARQPTHSPFETLQTGDSDPQAALVVQPWKHFRSALHVGAEAGQSALPRHWTQRPGPVAHTGAAVPQLPFARQATHCFVTGLQSGLSVPAQSMSAMHPTH